jgi:hypothetical protein
MAQKKRTAIERVTDANVSGIADTVNEVGKHVETGVSEVTQELKAKLRERKIDEETLPDAFKKIPKLISPRVHAWLDVAVTGYFLVLGTFFAIRRKKGPATAALINGGMVAAVSLLTDYDGTGEKPINFKLHGTLDAVQAATAALGPVLHNFAGRPESAFFYAQAGNEVAVIATTDWDRGMPAGMKEADAA